MKRSLPQGPSPARGGADLTSSQRDNMTNGFLIGNGTSREDFDLTWLKGRGVSIGCNRIWHDFYPDYIVSIDTEPTAQINAHLKEKPGAFRHITRSMCHEPGERWGRHVTCDGVEMLPAKYLNGGLNNNSGIMGAAYLAEVLHCDPVYLIGVDFFRPVPGADRNDAYSGYIGYSQGVVDAWNYLFHGNQDCTFIRVGPIAERDREFYDEELYGIWLCETFEEFRHHAGSKED